MGRLWRGRAPGQQPLAPIGLRPSLLRSLGGTSTATTALQSPAPGWPSRWAALLSEGLSPGPAGQAAAGASRGAAGPGSCEPLGFTDPPLLACRPVEETAAPFRGHFVPLSVPTPAYTLLLGLVCLPFLAVQETLR